MGKVKIFICERKNRAQDIAKYVTKEQSRFLNHVLGEFKSRMLYKIDPVNLFLPMSRISYQNKRTMV